MIFLDAHTRQGESNEIPDACVAFPGDKHNQSPGASIAGRDNDLHMLSSKQTARRPHVEPWPSSHRPL